MASRVMNNYKPTLGKGQEKARLSSKTSRGSMRLSRQPARHSLSSAERQAVFRRNSYRCVLCGRGEGKVKLEVDHIVPIARGGTNDPVNLQTLCQPCNRTKRDSLPETISF